MSSDGLNGRKRVVNKNEDTNEDNVSRVVSQVVSSEKPQNQSFKNRVMSETALSMSILVMVYYTTTQYNDTNEVVMASATQSIRGSPIAQQVMCSQDYNEDRVRFPSCAPQRCGRLVSDSMITESEAKHLLSLTKRDLSLGGSTGGASFFSLYSGGLSMDTNYVNMYELIERTQRNDEDLKELFPEKDLEVYRTVRNRVRKTIASHFGITSGELYLTTPTTFVRITAKRPHLKYNIYYRRHVDKRAHRRLHFTSVLYLSTYGADFSGGRLIFTDEMSNTTIEPKLGRLSALTSGTENEHFVERVTSGTRYSLLFTFTCDPMFALIGPQIGRPKTCAQPFCLLYGVGCPSLNIK
ncbi:unnamed protein product [Oppiella nova]|uniref:Fe2OG dioxygenase domain-containing protein n=1 Tax=Oppiella nova TaxID=334625 RepID=A0A7R9M7P2_9ACAR|nr:unnamed protein product [Oppiella nova]CAG2171135.1 unnamed protein product [Oppiella nova]